MSQRTVLQLSNHRCVQTDTGKNIETRLSKYFQYFDNNIHDIPTERAVILEN